MNVQNAFEGILKRLERRAGVAAAAQDELQALLRNFPAEDFDVRAARGSIRILCCVYERQCMFQKHIELEAILDEVSSKLHDLAQLLGVQSGTKQTLSYIVADIFLLFCEAYILILNGAVMIGVITLSPEAVKKMIERFSASRSTPLTPEQLRSRIRKIDLSKGFR